MLTVNGTRMFTRPPLSTGSAVWLDAVLGKNDQRDGVDFSQVEASALVDAIAAWIGRGYEMTFSRTSDGGAIPIALLAGEYRKKLYAASVDELNDTLTRIVEAARVKGGEGSEKTLKYPHSEILTY